MTNDRHASVPATGESWSERTVYQPLLASAGSDLLYQFGVGLEFMSTVRHDGGPRHEFRHASPATLTQS